MEHDIPASQKDRSLPMIVNLRGDEDLVDIFNWDADQTMEFLAIKRSRLTQISGKELRVGRIRRDRYLRPVFRESDVRDYQEWTRATATHQSSSRAIEQAIDSLDDRFSDLFVVLQEKLQQFEERSRSLLLKQVRKIDGALHKNFQILGEVEPNLLQGIGERIQSGQRTLHTELQDLHAAMQLSRKEMELLRGLFSQFHQDLRELFASQNTWRRDLMDSQAALTAAWQSFEAKRSRQDEYFQAQFELLQSSVHVIQETQVQLQKTVTEQAELAGKIEESPKIQAKMPRKRRPKSLKLRSMKQQNSVVLPPSG
ncbi:MAG: hypothetical protein NTX25_12815 [Proteobacteria bacterium]|nr:hypothetical protein [Pseudomonadota bacterium]